MKFLHIDEETNQEEQTEFKDLSSSKALKKDSQSILRPKKKLNKNRKLSQVVVMTANREIQLSYNKHDEYLLHANENLCALVA